MTATLIDSPILKDIPLRCVAQQVKRKFVTVELPVTCRLKSNFNQSVHVRPQRDGSRLLIELAIHNTVSHFFISSRRTALSANFAVRLMIS